MYSKLLLYGVSKKIIFRTTETVRQYVKRCAARVILFENALQQYFPIRFLFSYNRGEVSKDYSSIPTLRYSWFIPNLLNIVDIRQCSQLADFVFTIVNIQFETNYYSDKHLKGNIIFLYLQPGFKSSPSMICVLQ